MEPVTWEHVGDNTYRSQVLTGWIYRYDVWGWTRISGDDRFEWTVVQSSMVFVPNRE